jgi:hypothetical protein
MKQEEIQGGGHRKGLSSDLSYIIWQAKAILTWKPMEILSLSLILGNCISLSLPT